MSNKTIILSSEQVDQRIRRIAYQICEEAYNKKELILIGIEGNGTELNERLAKHLKEIGMFDVKVLEMSIDKNAPLEHPITLSESIDLTEKNIILTDDVVNSGRTMIYSVAKILESPIRSLNTVALVDRSHRRFPIRVNFSGIHISTTLQDMILVDFKENIAYLV